MDHRSPIDPLLQVGGAGDRDVGEAAVELDFAAFYDREHGAQVRRAFLLTRSNELANDIVHDAMIAVYERWERLDNPGGYLNRAVLNGCRDAIRRLERGRRRRRRLQAERRDHAPTVSESVVIERLLASLPFNQRASVVLRFYGGWTSEQIADALGCSPNSVGPWINRALTRLKEELS